MAKKAGPLSACSRAAASVRYDDLARSSRLRCLVGILIGQRADLAEPALAPIDGQTDIELGAARPIPSTLQTSSFRNQAVSRLQSASTNPGQAGRRPARSQRYAQGWVEMQPTPAANCREIAFSSPRNVVESGRRDRAFRLLSRRRKPATQREVERPRGSTTKSPSSGSRDAFCDLALLTLLVLPSFH